jgi:glc operon protein GlcG
MKSLQVIDYSEAKKIIDLIVEKASSLQKSIAAAVVDAHGELIAFARMDGVPFPSINIAINKAYTAARARKSTQEIGDKVRHPEKGYDIAYHGDAKFVGWGGGVPVLRDSEVIGAVGVSGLSAAEDADLAAFGARLVPGQ